jgi:hypothetical protein
MASTIPVLLRDCGVLAGVALCAVGVFQLSTAVGFIFVGLALVGLNVILALPRAKTPPSPGGDQ